MTRQLVAKIGRTGRGDALRKSVAILAVGLGLATGAGAQQLPIYLPSEGTEVSGGFDFNGVSKLLVQTVWDDNGTAASNVFACDPKPVLDPRKPGEGAVVAIQYVNCLPVVSHHFADRFEYTAAKQENKLDALAPAVAKAMAETFRLNKCEIDLGSFEKVLRFTLHVSNGATHFLDEPILEWKGVIPKQMSEFDADFLRLVEARIKQDVKSGVLTENKEARILRMVKSCP